MEAFIKQTLTQSDALEPVPEISDERNQHTVRRRNSEKRVIRILKYICEDLAKDNKHIESLPSHWAIKCLVGACYEAHLDALTWDEATFYILNTLAYRCENIDRARSQLTDSRTGKSLFEVETHLNHIDIKSFARRALEQLTLQLGKKNLQ